MTERYKINNPMYVWEVKLKNGESYHGIFVSFIYLEFLPDKTITHHLPMDKGKDFAFCPKINLTAYNEPPTEKTSIPDYIVFFNADEVEYFKTIAI